ncbi:GNAT family N-acetyltransferase [Actinotalea sp. M2MS4P-6]|uniref:GNAT family N-acetyltransferase n=1 Tax=Actinotalea sp. M2MS4P-6 TaxID=2983762 RepID=UPI0021E50485|nr:GNAT family N-acetyltransferase [Actinotalea sp. M2MS4P-6]MCV2393841.1 GNAT family N-acetyltransferase [Actinotalea sp. M2MS4P-6]
MMSPTAPPAGARRLIDSLDEVGINAGFVRAVLDGTVAGEVWTSSAVGVGAAYARHGYGMSLIWGDRLADAFDEVVAHLAERAGAPGREWLQVDPRWAGLPWAETLRRAAPGFEVTVDRRVNFAFDAERYAERRAAFVPAAGWTLHPAEAAEFDFPGSVVPAAFWRDAEQLLANGGGWRAERDGSVGALAFSSFPIYDGVEIGIETVPWARRQGLGAAVAAAMIDDVLDRGSVPLWACRRGNESSYRLAMRLGFVPALELPYLSF